MSGEQRYFQVMNELLPQARDEFNLPDEDIQEGVQKVLEQKPDAASNEVMDQMREYVRQVKPDALKRAMQPGMSQQDVGSLYDAAEQRIRDRVQKDRAGNILKGLGAVFKGTDVSAPFKESENRARQTEMGRLGVEAQVMKGAPQEAQRQLQAIGQFETSEINREQLAQNDKSDSPRSRQLQQVYGPFLADYYSPEEISQIPASVFEKIMPQVKDMIKSKEDRALKEQQFESTQADRRAAREQNMMFRQMMMGMKQDELSRKRGEDVNKEVTKLGFKLQDSGLEALDDLLSQAEDIITSLPKDAKGKPKDVPGFGMAARTLPGFMVSSQGKQLRQKIQKMANIELKKRSGAAVTVSEWQRFMQEFGSGKFQTEEELLNGLANLRSSINRDLQTLYSSVRPEAQDEYRGRQQNTSIKPEPINKPSLSPQDRASKQKELDEINKLLNKLLDK